MVNKEVRMSEGNRKIKGSNVLIFNLPAIKSCLNCSSCASTCYALKAERLYPDTRNSRAYNWELANNNLQELEWLILAQIADKLYKARKKDKKASLVVRIHESGDFFSQDYIKMWHDIARQFKDKVIFWTYTKVMHLFDFTELTSLPNVNIINSFIDGELLNYGSKEYVDDLVKNHGCFLCPAVVDKEIKCNIGCDYCHHGDKPVFYKH